MISKKKILRAIRTDLNTRESIVMADGICELQDDCRLIYRESGHEGAQVIVEADDRTMKIQRNAEARTTTLLRLNGISRTAVETEYGVFEIKNRTRILELSDSCWTVEYEVGSSETGMERFRIEWFFKEAEA